jgi:hypothetical protein
MRIQALLLPLLLLPAAALANGNVETERTNDGLIIRGDAGDNEFEVKAGKDAQNNDVLVIEGKNGTTINGQDKFEVSLPDGKLKVSEIDIEMASGGTDTVTVDLTDLPEGKRFSDVDIDDTRGTTTVKNVRTNGGKLRVETAGGATTLEGCDAGDLNVKANGTGSITIRDCNAGKLKVFNAGEDTTLTVEDSFYNDADVRSNGKAEVEPSLKARIERTAGKKISFQGGGADDEIAFEDNTIESVSAKLGAGNDLISFTGSVFDKTSIDGGAGALDCFDDMQDNNAFGSFKEKGFEPCDGPVELEYFGLGADPIDEPPQDAVAWRTNNPEIGHLDGPFALPGADNPLALPVLDPLTGVDPAHWADPDLCDWIHLHDAFAGHGDPAPGPPDTKSACGHGALEWARLVPAN